MRLFLIFILIAYPICSQINWTNFNTANSGIPYNQVNSIEIDSEGNIFIGTAYGLGVLNIDMADFSNNIWNVYFEANDPNLGLIGNDIINIQKNLNENMWICTTNGISILEYVSSFDEIQNEQWSYLSVQNSILPSNFSNTILFENERKWIGTSGGLVVVENNIWNLELFDTEGVFSNNIKKIIRNPQSGDVYIGTLNGGYQVYNGNSFENFNNSNCELIDNTINDFLFDINNNLIITSPFGGLEVLTPEGSWIFFNSETYPNLPFFINSLNDIIIDNNNNLWITTMENGLIKFSDNNWVFYNVDNSELIDNQINCLKYDDVKNHLWLGTETQGLILMDLNTINLSQEVNNNDIDAYFSHAVLNFRTKENGILNIYDITGKLIFTKNITTINQYIPIKKLEPAIYMLILETSTQNVTKKIMPAF